MLSLRGLVAAPAPAASPPPSGRASVTTPPGKAGRISLAIPAAATLSLVLWSSPAENQKKYAEFDDRFKKSKVLQDLLEKSKKNKEK
nr:unnamed protein product [Digitaria exilis]